MPRGKTVKETKRNKDTASFSKLRKYNLLIAALFSIQGIFVLFLSDPLKGVHPITTNYLAQDKLASEAAGQPVLATASNHLFDLNLAYVVAAFFFVGAVSHLLVASWRRKQYENDLNKGVNKAKWIEYALTAGIMMVGIALLTGVFDFASLLMIFALTGLMGLLGLTMELRNQNNRSTDWANYSLGAVAGVMPWLVLLIYVWSAVVYGNGVPGFLYWIYASLFILFSGFMVNLYLQYKRLGRWSTYLYGERVYIVLSFVAKTALAWQIFAGTLQ